MGIFDKFKSGLGKSSSTLTEGFKDIFSKKKIDETILEEMINNHPTVKGIRRIVEFDNNPRELTLSKSFIEGVNTLEKYGYHFEINVNHTQMDIVREFVKLVPNVPMILDHCGKPGIAEGEINQFKDDLAELSKHPNLWIKLSDLPVAADHETWTDDDIKPYIDATIDAFGFDRTIYAGDYPDETTRIPDPNCEANGGILDLSLIHI